MTPERFVAEILTPGLARLAALGGPPITPLGNQMMLAIAFQESGPNLNARYQHSPAITPGPARGFWQFELGGGASGVLDHRASSTLARALCRECEVQPHPAAVWRALEGHDVLATGFARLLLWTDPRPLPVTRQDGWEYYLRNWRPGRPHPQNWAGNWTLAEATLATGV
jgi:hypothetical protein